MPADHRNLNYPDNQRGWVLVVGLVILVMLTILSMALMKTTRLEEKMAGATRDMNLSFQAAESALRAAEIFIESKTDESDFNSLVVTNGIYNLTKDEPDNLFTAEAWTNTHSKEIDLALQGVASPPRYMIKKLKKIGCTPTVFRVTVRGTGGPDNRATLLRSHYAKVFSTDSTFMGPAGCNEGIKLWLDADKGYLFSDDSCAVKIQIPGEDVRCWKDRSNNNAHVKETDIHNNHATGSTRDHGEPQYQRDPSTLSGKPYVLFKKGERDALAHHLTTDWSGSHSLLFVVQQIDGPSTMGKNSSYFASGLNSDLGNKFQVGCRNSVPGGGCTAPNRDIAYIASTSGVFKFGFNTAEADQTRIYTIRNDDSSNNTTTYIDGVDTLLLQTTNPQRFYRYLIGLNRAAGRWNDFRLAEMVLYDRALDNGELNDIHEYLATKYGISSGTESYPVGRLSWEQLFPD